MPRLPRILAAMTVTLIALSVVGCESNSPGPDRAMTAADSPEPRPTADRNGENNVAAVIVQMTNGLRFWPATVTIEAGETVEWRNTSQRVHTVTADASLARDPDHVRLPEDAERFHSGRIQPGGAFEHRFEVPGEYRYFCRPHEEQNMLGRVLVEPADGDPDIVRAE